MFVLCVCVLARSPSPQRVSDAGAGSSPLFSRATLEYIGIGVGAGGSLCLLLLCCACVCWRRRRHTRDTNKRIAPVETVNPRFAGSGVKGVGVQATPPPPGLPAPSTPPVGAWRAAPAQTREPTPPQTHTPTPTTSPWYTRKASARRIAPDDVSATVASPVPLPPSVVVDLTPYGSPPYVSVCGAFACVCGEGGWARAFVVRFPCTILLCLDGV